MIAAFDRYGYLRSRETVEATRGDSEGRSGVSFGVWFMLLNYEDKQGRLW